ncbi:hypothetical protein J2TS4_26000 [Paenibacillus sp. J2TS4]|nr:hypothetical protein J2TS4_26000 [Paenibacillus sp. J2TS4]
MQRTLARRTQKTARSKEKRLDRAVFFDLNIIFGTVFTWGDLPRYWEGHHMKARRAQ